MSSSPARASLFAPRRGGARKGGLHHILGALSVNRRLAITYALLFATVALVAYGSISDLVQAEESTGRTVESARLDAVLDELERTLLAERFAAVIATQGGSAEDRARLDAATRGRRGAVAALRAMLPAEADDTARLDRLALDRLALDRLAAAADAALAAGEPLRLTQDADDALASIRRHAADRYEARILRQRVLIHRALMISITGGSAVMLVVLLGAIGLRRSMAGPITDLTAATLRLSRGEPAVTVPWTRRSDEIGQLARAIESFHVAAGEVRRLRDELLEAHGIARLGSWRWPVGACLFEWSDAMYAMAGRDPAFFTPTVEALAELVHADDRAALRAMLERVREARRAESREFRRAVSDGAARWCWIEARPERDATGQVIALRGVYQDVTERVLTAEHIRQLAYSDALTGLANRSLLDERMNSVLASARRRGAQVAVHCLDLDGFKAVNDLHGHAAGDALLRLVAARLQQNVRETDTVARLGGDEFVIVQVDVADAAEAQSLAARITAALEEPFTLGADVSASVAVSIGIALFPDDALNADALLEHAGNALYRVKHEGRGGYAFYRAEMDAEQHERRVLEQELRLALARNQFSLAYQPQVSARDGAIVGFEALIRWQHPELGALSPTRFIPLAEASGAIVPIGAWALRAACREAASWPQRLRIGVNVSPIQVRQGDLAALVRTVLAETGLAPERLELEVTESLLLDTTEKTLECLRQIKALGVRVVMDDFGTGYSSLASLQAFPFDKIKLDQRFVRELEVSPQASTIVHAVLGLGRGLGLPVTAEGVETEAQAAALRAAGCDELQGYLIGRPGPISLRLDQIQQTIEELAAVPG